MLAHREHIFRLFSVVALGFAVLLAGPLQKVSAQNRSSAWQERAQRSKKHYEQYVKQQRDQILKFAEEQGKKYRAAVERARKKGIPLRLKNETGATAATFHGFTKNGLPLYVSSTNEQSAEIINTKQLWSSPWFLDGFQEKIGIWEAGNGRPMESHQEFNGRITWKDQETGSLSSHATHVAGTMIAEGEKQKAHGMASRAQLYAWESENNLEEVGTASIGSDIKLSNHSYGFDRGWNKIGPTWYWYGDATVDEHEDYLFGFYDGVAQAWDEFSRNNRYHLAVRAAGNERDDGAPSSQPVGHYVYDHSLDSLVYVNKANAPTRQPDCNGGSPGYDCLEAGGVAKNTLVVGALKDDGTTPDVYSAFGPTDDGRIKPDIMANGEEVYSADTGGGYDTKSGTSMATPAVTGSIALLKELLGTAEAHASTLKALVLHTADDAIGPKDGPDYQTGWGRMNTKRAAEVIESEINASSTLHIVDQTTLDGGNTLDFEVTTTSETEPLRATIAWTDPAPTSTPRETVDPDTKMLLNDLNLRVIRNSNGTEHRPYKLDPSNPGSQTVLRGDNERDNVEQVFIPNPAADETYTLRVFHDGSLTGFSQDFGLTVTGNSSLTLPAGVDGGGGENGGGGGGDGDQKVCADNGYMYHIEEDITFGGTCIVGGPVEIRNGATLTLTPGATLKFDDCDRCDPPRSQITVKPGSKLVADGAQNDRVVFKRKGTEHWGGIVIQGDSSQFEYATFTGAGHESEEQAGREGVERRPALLIEAKGVEVHNSKFSANQGEAISAELGPNGHNSFTLTNSTVTNNNTGIRAYDTDAIVTGTTIKSNTKVGARFSGKIYFVDNNVRNNGTIGLFIAAGDGLTSDLSSAAIKRNTIARNGSDGVTVAYWDIWTFEKNIIQYNDREGVSVSRGARVYMGSDSDNIIRYNGSHEVSLTSRINGSRVYLGNTSHGVGGFNDIYDSSYGTGNRYVFHSTPDFDSLPAENNNWDATPTSGMFNGPVDYKPYLTPPLEVSVYCSPPDGSRTVTCTASATGGGGAYSYDWNLNACDGSLSCSVPCGGTSVSVTVTSASGETKSASTTTGQCLSTCTGDYCALSVDQTYDGVDEQKLGVRIQSLMQSLREQSGSKTGSAQRLRELYDLLLLDARVEEVRQASGGAVPTGAASHAFSGRRSEARSLFTDRASAFGTERSASATAQRRARKSAAMIMTEHRLRTGRSQRALEKARSHRAHVETDAQAQVGLYLLSAEAYQMQENPSSALASIESARDAALKIENEEARNAYLRDIKQLRRGLQERADGSETTPAASPPSPARSKTSPDAENGSSDALPQEFAVEPLRPNPTRSATAVPLVLPERARVHAVVYDLLGRRVEVVANRSVSAGRTDLGVSTASLSGGVYLIRVQVDGASGESHTFTEKLTVVK